MAGKTSKKTLPLLARVSTWQPSSQKAAPGGVLVGVGVAVSIGGPPGGPPMNLPIARGALISGSGN